MTRVIGAPAKPANGLSEARRIGGFAVAFAGVAGTSAFLVPIREGLGLETVLMLFVLISVVASAVGGVLPAVAAAVAGSFSANLFFTRPYGTLLVQEPTQVWDLAVFLAVAAGVGVIVEAGARDRVQAERASAASAAVTELGRREYGYTDNVDRLLWDMLDVLAMDRVELVADHTQTVATAGDPEVTTVSVRIPAGERLELLLYGPELLGADPGLLEAFGSTAGRLWRSEQLAVEATRAEQLTRIDQLRASLLAAVSHDLRTPLAAVKASVSTLRQEDVELDPTDQKELLATIEDNTDRLGRVIANLLDLSRLQAGVMSVELAPVAIDEVLAAALRRGRDRVALDLPSDLPLVLADAGLLERVFENLVDNAERHQPGDGIILVRARHRAGRVLVDVVDHGPGVPPERFESIFQPFQHFDDHTAAGVGLGLAIARGFTEAQGGAITPSATRGGGLTMTVDLAVHRT